MNPSWPQMKHERGRYMEVMSFGNPVLRRKSQTIAEITDEIRQLAANMTVTMFEHETRGVGLAAPQVGVHVRLITMATHEAGDELPPNASPGERLLGARMPVALINPEIVAVSESTAVAVEGCLSVPGIEGEVRRPAAVLLNAQTLDGETIKIECGGLLARCLQHEIDHLDGVLFVDRLDEETKKELESRLRDLEKRETRRLKKLRRWPD